jgi:hypothetical protein
MTMTLLCKTPYREYWITYDRSAGVYELFASEDGSGYEGSFDSRDEARAYVKHVTQMAEG